MDKIKFVKQALADLNIPENTGGRYNKSIVDLILYGFRGCNLAQSSATYITKKYFSSKPPNIKILHWLCEINNCKWCSSCDEILDKHYFSSNSARKDGLQSYCKPCQAKAEKPYSKAKTAKYRAAKIGATPKWANQKEISKIYKDCPKGYHVDHIIPLKGDKVCGLHISENLQYLSEEENLKKSNKWPA